MHLERVDVRRFGPLESLSLTLGPGLVVLHGPNEAGKSSLAAFLRYVWFGLRRSERPEGTFGGQLRIAADGGSLVLDRTNRDPAQLLLPDGRRLQGEAATAYVLGAVDRDLYEAIWSFSLADLTGLDALGEAALRDRLFSGAIAGAGRSVGAAQQRLRAEVEALWRPRRGGAVRELVARHDQLLAEVAAARGRVAQLGAHERERDAHEQARAAAIAAMEDGERRARRLRAQLQALPHHVAVRRWEAERAALPAEPAIPDALAQRAEALDAERAAARGVAEARAADRARAEQALDPAMTAEVRRALGEAVRAARDLSPAHLAAARSAAEQADAALTRAAQEAGASPAAARALRLGAAEVANLQRRADEVAALQARFAAGAGARAALDDARLERAALDARLAGIPRDPAAELTATVEQLLAEEAGARQRRSQAEVRRGAERELRRAIAADPSSRRWTRWAAVAVAAALLAVAALLAARGAGGEAAALVVLAGVVGVGGFVALGRAAPDGGEAARRAQADAHAAEAALLEAEYASWSARVGAAVAALGLPADRGLAEARVRCGAARRAEEERQQLAAARASVDATVRRLEGDEAALGSTALEQARAGLRGALAAVGLDEDTPAEGIAVRLLALAQARRADDEAQAATRALAALEAAAADLVASVAALGARPRDLSAGIAALAEAQARATAADQAEQAWRVADERRADAARALAEVEAQLVAVLADAGVPDLPTLRARLERARARAGVDAQIEQARQLRDAALGVHPPDPLDQPDDVGWERLAAEAEAASAEAAGARDAAVRALALKDRELDELRASADVARLDADRSSVAAQLTAARWRLARAELAQAMLERTLKRFRDAHQPAILAQAGAYVAAATDGVYVGVEPDEERADLVLVDRLGGRHPSDRLSTGTAALLYLVLRLGLVQDQVRGAAGPRLPIVLDDVLATVDPERARGVARLLGEVAARQQVLLFTCRPETRDLVREVVPAAAVVDLPRFGGRGPGA